MTANLEPLVYGTGFIRRELGAPNRWRELDLEFRRLNEKYSRERCEPEIQRNLAIISLCRAARSLK